MEQQDSAKKLTVLLSFVGNHDPWDYKGKPEEMPEHCPDGQKEGALLGLCDPDEPGHLSPDIVYLFPSGKKGAPDNNTEWRAERIKKIFADRCPGMSCRILPMNVSDATDFEQLSVALEENIDIVIKELGDSMNAAEFYFNCTSGTQQMTALSYVFANTGRIPGCILQQCKDPGKLNNGEPRIREVKATFLTASEYVKKARADIENLNFSTGRANCLEISRIAATKKQKAISLFLAKLLNVYNYMDILRYGTAKGSIHETLYMPAHQYLTSELRDLLSEQEKLLTELDIGPFENEKDKKGRKETPENLTDLYFNMRRCLIREAYADVFSRFWRICEGSVYYRLNNVHGVNPRDLENSRKDSLAKLRSSNESWRFATKPQHDRQLLLFDNARYALIDILDQGVFGGEFDNFFETDVKKMIAKRNNFIVAHGMDQVEKEDAELCVQYAERVLCTLIPSVAEILPKYPFREDALRSWIDLLLD